MRSVKNAAYLLVPLSLGTYAYSSYVHSHRKKKLHYDTSHFSDYHTQFIKQNDLVVPNFYYKLKRDSNANSFFFKAILNTVGGLDQFNIYTDKKLNDIINKDIDLSDEDRKKAIENAKLYCIFSANNKVENHDNVVHAGFTATLLDNMGGTLAFLSCGNKPVATASITVNYHKPIMTGEEYLTEVSSKKIDHNNVIVQGIIKDKNGVVFADADLMFIKVDWKNMVFSNILKNITEKVMGKTEEMEHKESRLPFVYMNVPDIVIDFQTDPKRKFRIGERYAKFC